MFDRLYQQFFGILTLLIIATFKNLTNKKQFSE